MFLAGFQCPAISIQAFTLRTPDSLLMSGTWLPILTERIVCLSALGAVLHKLFENSGFGGHEKIVSALIKRNNNFLKIGIFVFKALHKLFDVDKKGLKLTTD